MTAAALTSDASRRLVSPGTAFCSMSSVGMPRNAASADHRARAVPTDADHHRRTPTRDHAARRRGHSPAASASPREQRRQRLALQTGAANHVQREALARHDPRLDPGGRADEGHLRVRTRARSARAPPRCPDTDALPFRRRRSARTAPLIVRRAARCSAARPSPSRLISSDDPPELTSGSGMPLVGISPSTTLMFTSACTAIIVGQAERDERSERVLRAQRDAHAAPRDDAEADENSRRADADRALRRSPRR